MRKKKLLKQINDQCKVTENVMNIFKVLVEGGDLEVHVCLNKEPAYFLHAKDKEGTDMHSCTRKIFEGLYSRGLLVVTNESVHEDFAVQRYALRALNKSSNTGAKG